MQARVDCRPEYSVAPTGKGLSSGIVRALRGFVRSVPPRELGNGRHDEQQMSYCTGSLPINDELARSIWKTSPLQAGRGGGVCQRGRKQPQQQQ